MTETNQNGDLVTENQRLRQENAQLRQALEELQTRLAEPEDVIRAIREGEVDALVVQEKGQEQVYSLQRFDSVYRTMVEECFPYGVWLAKPAGQLLYVTPSFLKLLGTDLPELYEKGQFHFLPAGVRETVEREWARCRETGGKLNVEYQVELPDGSEKTIWTQGLLAQTPDGHSHWIGVNIDITARKKAEEALKEADRRKDEFLAMLAHELRNPMAPIRSGLDILAMDSSNHAETIKLLQEQVEHIIRLVDDLLDVSRIMRGRIELRKEPVELSPLVERSVKAVRPMVDTQGQTLMITLPDQPIWLLADPVRIVQILENLLNNASKYTDVGGRIELRAEQSEGEAVIRIQDTGIGIEPELQVLVFDLFTQASRSLDRAQGGLGIGLTLVQRLVAMHQGTVSVHSDGREQGSTFTVRLPVIEPQSPPDAKADESSTCHARRVLIVDDNVGAARMLAMLLEKLNDHQIEIVHDGPSALRAIPAIGPDVVLLDIGLPRMDGYQVAREIRQSRDFDDLLLVALTGYGQQEDRQKSKEAGFDEHLVKPPSVDQIRGILNHPKLVK